MGSEQQFTAQVSSRNGVASIALRGELDLATVPELEGHLAPFESDGVSAIMLDLRELTFIDSVALQSLVRARKRAETNGQRLIAGRCETKCAALVGTHGHEVPPRRPGYGRGAQPIRRERDSRGRSEPCGLPGRRCLIGESRRRRTRPSSER